MKIERLVGGSYSTNSYLIVNEIDNTCIIVDTFENPKVYLDYLNKNNLKCVAVLLTHGHFDHVCSVKILQDMGAKVYLHKNDMHHIENPEEIAYISGFNVEYFEPDVLIDKECSINVNGLNIKVLETPGHTNGSVCYILDSFIFVGDTIFNNSYGRFDFEDGSFEKLKLSIKKIFELEGEFVLLPGHGDLTSLNKERETNPILFDIYDEN